MKDKTDMITELLDHGFDTTTVLFELISHLPTKEVEDFVESFKNLYEVDSDTSYTLIIPKR